MHLGVERGERHAHVGRMRRDAGFAGAEDRVDAVDAARSPSSRCRARACCRASRCRRNRSSACVAGDCRRSTPCCAAAARRRPGSRSRAADSAARSAGDRRGRNSAPARRCAGRRRRSASTVLSGSREMSISRDGRSTSSFIRSIRLVPPAMNFASGSAAICRTASATSVARAYWKLIMIASHRLLDRRHDVGIGAAAADVAAHQFADLVGGSSPCPRRSGRPPSRSVPACSSRTGTHRDR